VTLLVGRRERPIPTPANPREHGNDGQALNHSFAVRSWLNFKVGTNAPGHQNMV